MSALCEVCAARSASETDGLGAQLIPMNARRVLVEGQLVRLCEEHAAEVELARVDDLDSLRALFKEKEGKRSLVCRRAALDRRMFPPRPEGRRLDEGRRVNDS